MRKFVRGFFVNPELEQRVIEAAESHKRAARAVEKAANSSRLGMAVAAVGLVGFGAFLATEEGSRFAGEVARGLGNVAAKKAEQLRDKRVRGR